MSSSAEPRPPQMCKLRLNQGVQAGLPPPQLQGDFAVKRADHAVGGCSARLPAPSQGAVSSKRAHPLGLEHGATPALPQQVAGWVGLMSRAGTVVEKVNLRLPDNRPGNGHPLAPPERFAAGRRRGALRLRWMNSLCRPYRGLPPRLLPLSAPERRLGPRLPSQGFFGGVADRSRGLPACTAGCPCRLVDWPRWRLDAGASLRTGLAAAGPADSVTSPARLSKLSLHTGRPPRGRKVMVEPAGPWGPGPVAAHQLSVFRPGDALCM